MIDGRSRVARHWIVFLANQRSLTGFRICRSKWALFKYKLSIGLCLLLKTTRLQFSLEPPPDTSLTSVCTQLCSQHLFLFTTLNSVHNTYFCSQHSILFTTPQYHTWHLSVHFICSITLKSETLASVKPISYNIVSVDFILLNQPVHLVEG